MTDKYKELAENIGIIINLIEEFEITKNDYKKPDIRAYQVKISSLGKIIGDKVKEDTETLNNFIDAYLSDPHGRKVSIIIEKGINLINDLWEL